MLMSCLVILLVCKRLHMHAGSDSVTQEFITSVT